MLRNLLATAVALATITSANAAEPQPNPVLLEFTYVHDMLAENDPQPLFRLYEDGSVDVHRPLYLAYSGDFRFQLNEAEVGAVLGTLLTDLETTDFEEAKEQRTVLARQRSRDTGLDHHISDTTWTVLRYRPSTGGDLQTVTWNNVYTDAQFYPGLAAVQILAEAENRLRDVVDRRAIAVHEQTRENR